MTLNINLLAVLIALSSLVLFVSCITHDFSDAFLDSNGEKIFCGLGPFSQECPDESYCNVAPNDEYAYCARPKKHRLPTDAIIDAGGNAIKCGPEWNCGSLNAVCKTDPLLPYRYCAHRPKTDQTHDFSDAFLDSNGEKIFCGLGPFSRECPDESYCNVAPNDEYAYCARPKKQRLPTDAIIDAGGNAIKCGPEWNCGSLNAVCKTDPLLPYRYCAHRPKTGQTHDFSDALLDSNGKRIFCGRGRSSQGCPNGSYCNIAPNDAYAYCARPKKQRLPTDAIIDAGGNAIKCGPEWNCGSLNAVCKTDPLLPYRYCAHPAVKNSKKPCLVF